jgi:hypothetical protein
LLPLMLRGSLLHRIFLSDQYRTTSTRFLTNTPPHEPALGHAPLRDGKLSSTVSLLSLLLLLQQLLPVAAALGVAPPACFPRRLLPRLDHFAGVQ